MKDFRDIFLDRAFKIVPGVAYNQSRRELIEQSAIVPVIYELVFPEKGSWEEFRDKTIPLMMRYIKSQGIDPEFPKLLIVAIFYRDKCYFLEGEEFRNALCELEGLNSQSFRFRLLRWLNM
ncbi:MAG: STAUR_1299 family protein [Verrucomicrobiia bacterium]|jgi:hypothetical protein